MTCQGVSVPPQSKITAATAMDDMLRTRTAPEEALFRLAGYCDCPPTVWMECAGELTVTDAEPTVRL